MEAKIDITNKRVIVTLSKRNLLALISKIGRPESAATIYKSVDGGYTLFVAGVLDTEHYIDRKPGLMHPKDEAFIQAYKESK